MRKWLSGDRVAGVIFVILGGLALVEGWRLLPLRSRGMPGDDAFPLLLGAVMVVLGALLAFVLKPRKKGPVLWPKGKQAVVMLEGAGVLIVYWLVLPYLGFAISTFCAGTGLFYTIGNFRWYGCLLFSAILTSAFYGIFVVWLNMPFPIGVIGI
jgi:putative tricarboxylic transport membrane protein